MTDWGLAGRTVLLTGASSGIGAATAVALGSAGASVVLVARDRPRLERCAAAVEDAGGKPHVVTADLTDVEAAEATVDRAVEAAGPLYGMVHCASVFDAQRLQDTTFESFERQWRANVAAPLFMTRRALPHLEHGASIVLVSSTTGLAGFSHSAAYGATKGAVIALGRALAIELARKEIRVNTVVPGYVRTPMLEPLLKADGFEQWIVENTPQARIGTAEELANAILFMVSGLSSYVDGTTLVVDGGWLSR